MKQKQRIFFAKPNNEKFAAFCWLQKLSFNSFRWGIILGDFSCYGVNDGFELKLVESLARAYLLMKGVNLKKFWWFDNKVEIKINWQKFWGEFKVFGKKNNFNIMISHGIVERPLKSFKLVNNHPPEQQTEIIPGITAFSCFVSYFAAKLCFSCNSGTKLFIRLIFVCFFLTV